MHCQYCASRLEASARFCSGCGKPVTAHHPQPIARQASGASSPEMVLRPTFVAWPALLGSLPLGLFFFIWSGGFVGGFGFVIIDFFKLPIPGWLPAAIVAPVLLFLIPFLTFLLNQKTYDRTEYHIYKDKMDYYEGFWTIEEKTIELSNIREVNLRKGVIQQRYNLGTIILSTNAHGYSTTTGGIMIRDVENPDEVYRRVKALVETARRGAPSQAA